VVLSKFANAANGRVKRLVIRDTTSAPQALGPIEKCVGCAAFLKERADEIREFEQGNRSPKLLQSKFHLKLPYDLVPQSKVDDLFRKVGPRDPWENFYAAFPAADGYVEVAAVGFNRNKTRAVVYAANHCGRLCGGGNYSFWEKGLRIYGYILELWPFTGEWGPSYPETNCIWVS